MRILSPDDIAQKNGQFGTSCPKKFSNESRGTARRLRGASVLQETALSLSSASMCCLPMSLLQDLHRPESLVTPRFKAGSGSAGVAAAFADLDQRLRGVRGGPWP
mmetsp:Transcript_61914/g.110067  ORF Transcript_61914/g.110067 Transcript_61914/m.110067 type:complete len:105 (+) Transcript_61914:43-357(+)|eukprot:CAMPEP_0197626204 /NCGR_PEP_ID=MMETSP1338-20131121/5279_1 /TAXON_ID=43686 ORGANISM="Pelagodinium beii, Strain RCC1491" /NCGR_SAMPLE_ID=MMETSP1338 /ASSEMBLY_ACC=CAM_ASM_000754 /LENGTH=104 /DNA_ID=CAMNT_0043196723 /DNA_START=43 /DNA_END=357 /DNA_ORIENTATION=+